MPFKSFTVLFITARVFIAVSIGILTDDALAQDEPEAPNSAPKNATNAIKNTSESTTENTHKTTTQEAAGDIQAPIKPLGPPSIYQYTQTKQHALIATEIQLGNTVWLSALGENFLATWYPEHSGSPKGAALIIPNHNTNPSEQHTLANLHHYLSANGWSTLAISLPAQHRIRPPARPAPLPSSQSTPATDTDEAPETAATPDPQEIQDTPDTPDTEDSALTVPPTPDEKETVFQDPNNTPAGADSTNTATPLEEPTPDASVITPVEPLALARIGAGINYLQAQSQFNNVIIAEGIGAARALRFLQALEADDSLIDSTPEDIVLQHPLRALVIINAEHHLTETPELDIPTALAALPIPLLDIHTQHFQQHSARAAQQLSARKKALANSDVPIYVTRTLNSASVDQKGEHRLTRIIRGFLYQHAQGKKDTR
ncbi:DUF3530 family protein [Marinagarivorans algicola]|uniref:DUF3530 family protein n=1 Tax=Marinagarivorans algicola TaxID=1513270 RepID=UPI0006B56F82|nr:DUF3530 family protein [Marinagarivorans algicola]